MTSKTIYDPKAYDREFTFYGEPDQYIPRHCGVEIEGYNLTEEGRIEIEILIETKWDSASIGSDCTINPTNQTQGGPFELRTAPAAGTAFVDQLRDFTKILDRHKAMVNETCGLHVHVDTRDFDGEATERLIEGYKKIEPYFAKLVAPHRLRSEWCRLWKEQLQERIDRTFNARPTLTDTYAKMGAALGGLSTKSRAMNFGTMRSYGTVENRLMESTIDFTQIARWALINSKFVELMKNSTMDQVKAMRLANIRDVMDGK